MINAKAMGRKKPSDYKEYQEIQDRLMRSEEKTKRYDQKDSEVRITACKSICILM